MSSLSYCLFIKKRYDGSKTLSLRARTNKYLEQRKIIALIFIHSKEH